MLEGPQAWNAYMTMNMNRLPGTCHDCVWDEERKAVKEDRGGENKQSEKKN